MNPKYRSRYARSSPLWQCLHDSLEAFTTSYYTDRSKYLGPLDHSRETALRDSLQDWLREQSGIRDGRAGIVLAIDTFGDYLAYHPPHPLSRHRRSLR